MCSMQPRAKRNELVALLEMHANIVKISRQHGQVILLQ